MTVMRLPVYILVGISVAIQAAEAAGSCEPDESAKAFAICLACHTAKKGAGHFSGPNLWGVYGRPAGTGPGYEYSDAISKSGVVWNADSLNSYLANPSGFLPGTRMALAPIRDSSERAAIACYLQNLSAQPEQATAAPYQGSTFRIWSPVVADLDATIHLYRDILGFELAEVTTDTKTSYFPEMYNIDPGVVTRHAVFDAGDAKRVLSAVEVPGLKPDRLPSSPRMAATLINANGRFDEIVNALQDEGYIMMTPHALGDKGIEIGFLDRDGHLYALYEYPYSGGLQEH